MLDLVNRFVSGHAAATAPGAGADGPGNGSWLDTEGGPVHLLEVWYEDVNDALLEKHEGLRDLIPDGTSSQVERALEEFAFDVLHQVLDKAALDAAQMRFVATYIHALSIAMDRVGDDGDPHAARIGVLAHSLGTLVAFEGLHRAADSEDILDFVPVRLVLCAPMLAPIHAAQARLPSQSDRYLVSRGPVKPTRFSPFDDADVPVVSRCLALFDRDDPFIRLHSDEFYAVPEDPLVDELVKYSSDSPAPWSAHDMVGSYLTHNRDRIVETLFG